MPLKHLLSLAVIVGLATPVWADGHSPREVIRSQLDAFGQDDFSTAFTFASPMSQSMFGTAERFGTMVVQGYPMVWRQQGVRFLETGRDDRQELLITDEAGRLHQLEYEMIEGPAGWKINGVRIVPQSGV